MLEAIAIEKCFGKDVLFSQLSFQLPNQGLILLTGPSGSGKTTLLKILQLNESYSGRLRFDGIELSLLNRQAQLDFRRLYLASVQQEVELIPHATIEDHLEIIRHLKGDFIKPYLKRFIQEFQMEVNSKQTISTLSRGQQQRFAILLACIGQTKILLLDEPTTGLDYANRQKIYQLLTMVKQHQLIVMSSHQALHDGVIIDGHLNLAKPEQLEFQVNPKKAKMVPVSSRMNLPFTWYFQFHYRQRKFQKYRKRIHLFQTFVLATIGVMISLMVLVGKEFIRITETMIGGQYQYVKPQLNEEIELESSHSFDTIFNSLPFSFELRSYYDESYFEFLKPYHRFYIEQNGFEMTLKDIDLGLINITEKPPVLNPPLKIIDFQEEDVMLGLQHHHLRMLSKTLNCFPTLNSINAVLSNSPLSIYLKIHVPEWHYQDQILFTLRSIDLTDLPRWYHPHMDYPQKIYEERMRLPTRGIEEVYEFQPWRVAKTTVIEVKDDLAFLKLWQDDYRWQDYHVKRHPLLGWQIYKSRIPRRGFYDFHLKEKTFHYHSQFGYHYYPDQKLSGFAQPLIFNPTPQGNHAYLETIKQLEEPFDWLNVIPPPQTTIGYLLANPGTSVKLKTDLNDQSMALDEVIVSKQLMTRWNLQVGDFVYIDHGIFPTLNENGHLAEMKQSMLKIVGTREMDGHWLFHYPHWLSHWLMIHAGVPSYLLEPEALIFYEQIWIPEGFESINPLKQVQDSITDILQTMVFILGIWCLFVGFPLLVLFFYYSIQSFISDQKPLKTLKAFGAPWLFINHWYGTKFILSASEVVVPTLWMMTLLDLLLKHWLGQYFYLSLGYEFPWESLTIFMIFSTSFYLVSTHLQMRVLKTILQNN